MTTRPPSTIPEIPPEEQTTEKVSISIRFPKRLASWLRQKALEEDVSLNEFVVSGLKGLQTWFSASPPVAEVLEADRRAFGDSVGTYILRLLQYRYDEIGRDTNKLGQPPSGPVARK
jgi:hypothetical protein